MLRVTSVMLVAHHSANMSSMLSKNLIIVTPGSEAISEAWKNKNKENQLQCFFFRWRFNAQ